MDDIATLRNTEERLQRAQVASDVGELDRLLHPALIFVRPDGTKGDKSADLDAHRSGGLRINSLQPEDLEVRVSDNVGVTMLTASLMGEVLGDRFSARMCYTRSWAVTAEGWRVVAAHISVIEPT